MSDFTPEPMHTGLPAPQPPQPRPPQRPAGPQPVAVVALRLPFLDLMWFLVKLSLAAIPACIILALIGSFLWGLFIGLIAHAR